MIAIWLTIGFVAGLFVGVLGLATTIAAGNCDLQAECAWLRERCREQQALLDALEYDALEE